MSKEENIKIFEDTMTIIENSEKLKENTKKSIDNTIIYEKKEKILQEKNEKMASIKVVNDRTINSVKYFTNNEKIAILNFASATNPGGGVTKGSNAQEECLCRISNLYKILSTKTLWNNYYKINREKHDTLYSNTVIYSPQINVIKADTSKYTTLSEEDWYTVDVITCAAPNLRERKIKQTDLLEIHKERARCILTSAIINNSKNIVLGAFGCGAFQNPPEIVARAYKEVLIDEEYAKYFDEIIFAVLSSQKDIINFNTFYRIFSKYK